MQYSTCLCITAVWACYRHKQEWRERVKTEVVGCWRGCLSGLAYGPADTTAGRLKMRDMKMRDQFARVENAGKVSMESQSVKKCLKVVVFVCRVIPSV